MPSRLLKQKIFGGRRLKPIRAERKVREDARAERVRNSVARQRQALRRALQQKKRCAIGRGRERIARKRGGRARGKIKLRDPQRGRGVIAADDAGLPPTVLFCCGGEIDGCTSVRVHERRRESVAQGSLKREKRPVCGPMHF